VQRDACVSRAQGYAKSAAHLHYSENRWVPVKELPRGLRELEHECPKEVPARRARMISDSSLWVTKQPEVAAEKI
jgi:hypothetical protein